jgi:hypothetical protein
MENAMELPNTILGWILMGCLAIVTGCVAYGLHALIIYLSVNIHGTLWDQLRIAAVTKVKALEQDPSLGGLASEDKKERAMVYVISLADKMGLNITVAEASDMIEEAVYMLQKNVLPAVESALE